MPTTTAPIIDVAPFFSGGHAERAIVARDVAAACGDIGFLLVTGHGVPQGAIDDLHDTALEFFSLPLEVKRTVRSPVDNLYQGYAHPGPGRGDHTSERQSFNVQRFDTAAEALAAGYPADVGEHLYDALWPAEPASFAPAVRRYMREMEALAARLVRVFEAALGLEVGRLAAIVERHMSNQAVNYYSDDIASGHAPSPYRFKAHRDGSMFTIVYQDDGPGSLQLHRARSGWEDVPAVDGTFVVNTGEVLERLTDGRWPATPHRVLNPPPDAPRVPRISAPYFVKPDLDAVIDPLPELRHDVSRFDSSFTGRTWAQRNLRNIDDGYDSTRQFEDLVASDPSLA